jgi:hypothetical protein
MLPHIYRGPFATDYAEGFRAYLLQVLIPDLYKWLDECKTVVFTPKSVGKRFGKENPVRERIMLAMMALQVDKFLSVSKKEKNLENAALIMIACLFQF